MIICKKYDAKNMWNRGVVIAIFIFSSIIFYEEIFFRVRGRIFLSLIGGALSVSWILGVLNLFLAGVAVIKIMRGLSYDLNDGGVLGFGALLSDGNLNDVGKMGKVALLRRGRVALVCWISFFILVFLIKKFFDLTAK